MPLKARPYNVVDLGRCKSHLSYYTCLSRSASAEGTVVVQGFDAKKITNGISGYLRQEFRELNLLDEITTLRYNNALPTHINSDLRNPLIRSYQLWQKNDTSSTWHPALRWKQHESHIKEPEDNDLWHLTKEKQAQHKSESLKRKKRKLSIQKLEPALSIEHVSKKSKTSEFAVDSYETGPVGFIWDKLNWSCSYDAVLTIFLRIWSMKPAVWTTEFSNTNVFMHTLALEFQKIQNNYQIMEQTRDSMHTYLHLQSPSMFPMGTQGAAVMNVLSTVLDEKSCGTINLYCKSCLYKTKYASITNVMHLEDMFMDLNANINDLLAPNKNQLTNCLCSKCGESRLSYEPVLTHVPKIWAFGLWSLYPNTGNP